MGFFQGLLREVYYFMGGVAKVLSMCPPMPLHQHTTTTIKQQFKALKLARISAKS
jgi:hypothetical protein